MVIHLSVPSPEWLPLPSGVPPLAYHCPFSQYSSSRIPSVDGRSFADLQPSFLLHGAGPRLASL
jgi:hypothetical protein